MRADIEAEQAVLGGAIVTEKAHPALLSLTESDFVDPRHRIIAAVLRDMIRRQIAVSRSTLTAELRARGKLDSPGGIGSSAYLHDLVDFAPPALTSSYYADHVRTAARVRAASAAAQDLVATLDLEESSAELEGLLMHHRARLDAIPETFNATEDQEMDTIEAIMAETFESQSWLIPGLFGRGDRVVVTGGEGLAKSTLSRQVAMCVAGGLNPFNGQRVADGQRVLYIDAENSRMQTHNAYDWIAPRVNRPMIAPGWSKRILHKTRNEGCDLPGRDAGWFHQVADQHSPDLIVLGPAYKLMRGDPQKDADVLAFLQVIDEVRVKHNAAVLIETHSPHGNGNERPTRPYGSSVWLRWPEIGFGLRPIAESPRTDRNYPTHLELISWRGQREYRDWPDEIRHGWNDDMHRSPRETLPWTHTRDDWHSSVNVHYELPADERGAA
jgi:hypothetical protein